MSPKTRVSWLKRVLGSVFTKLLLVILATGICLNLIIGISIHFAFPDLSETPFQKNLVQYADYLIKDLGDPPSFDRAKEISRQSSLAIRYEGPVLSWSTSEELPPFGQLRPFRVWHESAGIKIGRYLGRHLLAVEHGEGQFLFEFGMKKRLILIRNRLFIALIVLSTALLAGAYMAIRRILRPLRWLSEGVQQVSEGNFDHRVPFTTSNELRDLADAFNAMIDRIRITLHAKEQLLLDVSHELRSPITRTKLALEFLPDSQAKNSIQDDAAEMETVVSQILEAARLRSAQGPISREPVDLVYLIREVMPAFEGRPPGVEIGVVPARVVVPADRDKVKRVLKSILGNAIRYSNSSIEPVKIAIEHDAPYVLVRIQDRGTGIPKEAMPYILEPFYRPDKSRSRHSGGYGLGLSLCKTIMEAHQGRIEVDSTSGEGTTVSLFFPDSEQVALNNSGL